MSTREHHPPPRLVMSSWCFGHSPNWWFSVRCQSQGLVGNLMLQRMSQILVLVLGGNRLWNSLMSRFEFFTFSTGSQSIWQSSYPYHLTKYCSFLQNKRESKIFSTSYSNSASGSTSIGGGSGCFRPGIVLVLYFESSDTWNTGCTGIDLGSLSL